MRRSCAVVDVAILDFSAFSTVIVLGRVRTDLTVTVKRERNARTGRDRTEKTKPFGRPLGISRRLPRRSVTFSRRPTETPRAPVNRANGTLCYYKDNAPSPIYSPLPLPESRPVTVYQSGGRGLGGGGARGRKSAITASKTRAGLRGSDDDDGACQQETKDYNMNSY